MSRSFGRVRYSEVYEGIDVEYYGNQKQLEYDFHLEPGADHRQIGMKFEGADSIKIEQETGDLLIAVDGQTLRQHKPFVYQEVSGERIEIESRFALDASDRVGFQLAAHDKNLPLVIDPVLMYSTFLGGRFEDTGYDIAVDSAGNAYVTGSTFSTNFPTVGAIQGTPGAFGDVFVTKINPTGSAIVYSTYIGGSESESGAGIAVDLAGNAYITGTTESTNFPTIEPIYGDSNLVDGFVTKINATGSAILYSTYIGGSGEDRANSIAVDQSGSAFVTGVTASNDFPTVNPIQSSNRGGGFNRDVFVSRVNPAGSSLVYSTYLGSNEEDTANRIAVDEQSNAYVTGFTRGFNFPIANAIQSTNASQSTERDAFVTKINGAGSALVYSTYLGGFSYDEGYGIAVDSARNVYVTGSTDSTNFPTVNPIQGMFAGISDAFITKINSAGSAIVYSTYLGGFHFEGGGEDIGYGIAVDQGGKAIVTGRTNSSNFPVINPLQSTSRGQTELFVAKVNQAGSAFIYSTYLGGTDRDRASSIALNSDGDAHITGTTYSVNFPTVNPIQNTLDGTLYDAFIVKIAESGIPPTPLPTPTPTPSPIPTPVPSPLPPVAGDLVISQIYGGGGTAGATYRNSYVEIFNRKALPVATNAYAVALGLGTSAIDRSYSRTSSQGIVIQPGQYLLVRMGSGGGNGADLPQPDLDAQTQPPGFPSSFFAFMGKLALTTVGADNSIFTNCPLGAPGLLDFVGFGPTNCFEGSGPITGLSVTAAAFRKNTGCLDTNNNASDFVIGAPIPRNSSSPFNPCFVAPTPTPTVTPTPTPSPTPALLTISGRAITDAGAGLRALAVILTRDDGVVRNATTSSFGFFSFEGLESGRSYVVSVRSKRYRFAPQIIQLSANVTDLQMIALE